MLPNPKKLIGLFCVILLGASLSMARTSKKASTRRASATTSKSHSTHSAAAARGKSRSSKASTKASSKDSAKAGSRVSSKTAKARGGSSSKRRSTKVAASKGESETQEAAAVPRRPRGQRGIDGDRAREIQEALIREHYLDGDVSGIWDARTREAMMRFQNDNGWQTRIVPDSRALIKLGLGPKHAGLLNPGAASESVPDTAREMFPGGATTR